MNHFFERAQAIKQWLVDQCFPPQCSACRAPTSAHGNLCQSCFGATYLIAAPYCTSCGIPFSIAGAEGMQCGVCIASPPSFDVARSVMVYNAVAAKQIAALKFHDRSSMLQHFARAMQHSGAELIARTEMIVPVPLHRRRLLTRRYNQAAWLGFALSQITALPCMPSALKRVRYTGTQTGKRRKIRLQNLHGAFVVPRVYVPRIHDAHILLIDDVMTTGATANACAKALKKAGAKWVGVLTLAHTVLEV